MVVLALALVLVLAVVVAARRLGRSRKASRGERIPTIDFDSDFVGGDEDALAFADEPMDEATTTLDDAKDASDDGGVTRI